MGIPPGKLGAMTNQLDWLTQALAGRYRVQRLLGLNGFLVYLAHDLKHNREVVLKVTRDEWLAVTERFLRESTLIGQLEHPHILPLLESGHASGPWFLRDHVPTALSSARASANSQLESVA